MTDPATPRARATWPLYLVAGLSFIPIVGFFIGSIAVSWGLVSGRPGARRAVAIAATGALLNAVGAVVLMSTAARSGSSAVQQGYRGAVVQGLAEVVQALEEHRAKAHSYPESLQALQRARGALRPVQVFDLGAGVFRIPRPFQYVVAPDGMSYDLYSVGPDGKPGTEDDIRPAAADSLPGKRGAPP